MQILLLEIESISRGDQLFEVFNEKTNEILLLLLFVIFNLL